MLIETVELALGSVALTVGVVSLLQRRAAKKARAQWARLEQLSTAGAVAAGVVHEVRNPLVGIVGFAQLGKDSSDVKEMREYFALIEQDARRANQLLESLLDATQLSVGDFESVSVNDTVEAVLQLARPQLEMNGVSVHTALAPTASLPKVTARPSQLKQLLLNLVLNANDAVHTAVEKRVTVSTEVFTDGEKRWVRLCVHDSGPGFSAEAKRHAFTPFFTTKPRGQGTGLGLHISRQLAQANHGTLKLENGPGAKLVLSLPAATG